MANKKVSVLIVDDEQMVCDLLDAALTGRGYCCTTALSGRRAVIELESKEYDLVLLDIRLLPGMSGIDVLHEIWLNYPETAAIMITAIDDAKTAVEAMKWGASDYIVKPFDIDRVIASIDTALAVRRTGGESSREMDTVTGVIEAKLGLLAGDLETITQKATALACKLGIPEKEVRKWKASRITVDRSRDRAVRSSTKKLKRNILDRETEK